jgi:D-amino peptidase
LIGVKVYIVCDIEGVAGVVDFKLQCMTEGRYYDQATRMATLELNALVEGVLEGGATEVYAWPGHGAFPGGINVELLHPECRLVMHAGDAGPVGYDESFDAMFLCGLHAMAGADGGVLSHSFTPLIENLWLNGLKMGEVGLNMASFGDRGIPTVFLSGDEAAVKESQALVPRIEGAIVKWGLEEKEKLGALSVRKAVSLSPEKAWETIRDAARRVMAKIGDLEPFKLEPPYTMRVQYIEEKYAEGIREQPGIFRVNDTTVEQIRDNLDELVF